MCTKYLSFSFFISASNEHLFGFISSNIELFVLLLIQVIVRSFLQHHNSKIAFFLHSVFLVFQLSKPYVIVGKTMSLTIHIFVVSIFSLYFNSLSVSLIIFLPNSNNSLFGIYYHCVNVGAQKDKICLSAFNYFNFFNCLHWVGIAC